MKRTISFLLAFALVLTSTACGQSKEVVIKDTPAEPVVLLDIPWDLSAIYPEQAAFEEEFSQAEAQINAFADMRGKLNTVEGVVGFYAGADTLNRLVGRLNAYSVLQVNKDQSNSTAKELSGRVSNLVSEFSTETAFVLPEILAADSAFLDRVAEDVSMKPYLTWFSRDRAMGSHMLPEEQEQILQATYQLRDGAYTLFSSLVNSDLVFKSVKFPDGTERMADENNYLAALNKDYTQEFRSAYYEAMMQPYKQFRNTLAQNMQNYYTAVTKSAAYHNYSSALEAQLAPAATPMSVYDGVLLASNQAEPVLERYFGLLKKSLDVTTLNVFETNISIAAEPGTVYAYGDAQTLVKEALAPLGVDYAANLDGMLSGGAIDVYPAKNKSTGGFALSVPGTHPYILLNYTNDLNSVSTLAHELGHAVHMTYSQNQESIYEQNVTALTSEVASTLNELLLSDYLIENAKTEVERKYFSAKQMSKLYSIFFTQTFFARFQEAIATEVENGGTLTADKLDKLWLQATKDGLGLEYDTTNINAVGWARIPHFYSGFYVYQYAVGIAAACDIAERIQSGDTQAVDDYLTFLKAGDSGNTVEMLGLAGVDLSNGDYISAFNTRFERLITEFESEKSAQ